MLSPELADRLRAIVARLRESGTWDRLDVWEPSPADEATLGRRQAGFKIARSVSLPEPYFRSANSIPRTVPGTPAAR